jgi:hypothetical protein
MRIHQISHGKMATSNTAQPIAGMIDDDVSRWKRRNWSSEDTGDDPMRWRY